MGVVARMKGRGLTQPRGSPTESLQVWSGVGGEPRAKQSGSFKKEVPNATQRAWGEATIQERLIGKCHFMTTVKIIKLKNMLFQTIGNPPPDDSGPPACSRAGCR